MRAPCPPDELERAENEMFIACPFIMKPKENYGKLLAIPSEDMTGKYARYWLASAYYGSNLWDVDENGSVGNIYISYDEFGVRPVVACT